MSLYLKYRPKDFESLVGQDFVKNTLRKAVEEEKTVGAYLFCGPRGTGKTSTARIFTKALNCKNIKSGNPCNNCEICKAINNESLVDVVEIDAASHTGVDNIREIIEKAQFSPTHSKYKVYIIDEVHMLSKGAFNALLKILEEPPKFVKFILATTETHKVPETIISRCQRYDFKNISLQDIKKRLEYIAKQENVKIDEKSLDYIATSASGGLRNAISLFEQLVIDGQIKYKNIIKTLGIVEKEVLADFLEKLEKKDSSVVADFEKLVSDGKNLKIFFKELIFFTKNKAIKLANKKENISKLVDILEILDDTYSKTKNSLDENTTLLIGILKIVNVASPSQNNTPLAPLQKGEQHPSNSIPEEGILNVGELKQEKQVVDKNLAHLNTDKKTEELDLDSVEDIFGEESDKKDSDTKNSNTKNFDKDKFLVELKKAGVKGLIISSLKHSQITLNKNTLKIKFQTNFVKKQFDKEENKLTVKKILENMGFEECGVELK